MSDTVVLEIDGRAVGLLVPEPGCVVFRSALPDIAHLDGFPFRDWQHAYRDVRAALAPPPTG